MNERITSLASIAHAEMLVLYRKRMETEFAGDVIFSDMYDRRFAELIINECVLLSVNNGGLTGRNIANIIQKHFGMEE